MQASIQKFKDNAELTTTEVFVVNKSRVAESIAFQLKDENNILVSLKSSSFLSQISQSKNIIQHPSKDELKDVSVCLTDSICGISSTGSVVLSNDDYASYYSMLTSKHIVILDSQNIVEKPRDIFQNEKLKSTSSYSVITGPSATADMGSLVRGVHGPEKLLIIISVEDE